MFGRRASHESSLPFVRHRPTTNPILPVESMDEAIEFYERLGFEVAVYDDGYAWIKHCGWEWFHLRKVESVGGNQSSAYLHVTDAEAWRGAMLVSSGDTVDLTPTENMPWGKREFSFTDPAGNLIRLGSDF